MSLVLTRAQRMPDGTIRAWVRWHKDMIGSDFVERLPDLRWRMPGHFWMPEPSTEASLNRAIAERFKELDGK